MDRQITLWFGELLGSSSLLDETILTLSSSHLIKGGALVALLLYIWVAKPGQLGIGVQRTQNQNRVTILTALVASVFAEIFALILSHKTDFRLRPFLEKSLDLQVPDRLQLLGPEMMTSSSFPSDHAILFFAIVGGIFMVSRGLGMFAFLYCSIFIALPRIYLGLHYTSDILVGAAIGLFFAIAGTGLLANSRIVRGTIGWSHSYPAVFYPVFFLFLYQVATMLEDLRAFMQLLKLL
ncbi:MAG: phosphatase PAP2 family protein [Parasphingorhabdus sp.]